jgi:hypothetical protein
VDLNNIKLGGGAKKKKKKMSRRDMPVKRSINLARVGEKPLNLRIAIPAIVLIILGAMALGKFAVLDRLMAVDRAQSEVAALQAELDADYKAMNDVGDLVERYAHYTYSGMTQEELERTDRVKVLKLLQKAIIPKAEVNNWTVSGNLLTLNLMRSNLQEINLLVQDLNGEKLVDYCTVTTATTGNRKGEGQNQVNAQVLVYLVKDDMNGGEAQEEPEGDLAGDAIDAVTDTVVGAVAGDITDDLQAGKESIENNEDIK